MIVDNVVGDASVDSGSPAVVSMATVSIAEVAEAQVGEVCSGPVDVLVTGSEVVVVAWLHD